MSWHCNRVTGFLFTLFKILAIYKTRTFTVSFRMVSRSVKLSFMPNFCTQDNKLCIGASKTNDYINVTITADSSIGYGAFGTGNTMDGSDMILVWNINNQIGISNRKGRGHDIDLQKNVWNVQSKEVIDNSIRVTISRLLELDNRPQIKSINSFIWCWSLDKIKSLEESAAIPYHDLSGTFTMNLESGELNIVEKASSELQTSHGILMCLAWLVLIPFSTILSRFFKLKLANWFKIHKIINISSSAIVVLALLLIIIDRNGIVFIGKLDPHPIFGIFIFVLLLLQVFLGFFIDQKFNRFRKMVPLRDRLHWYLGYFTIFLSVINVFLGMKTSSSKVYGYVFLSIFLVYILVWIVLNLRMGRVHEVFEASPESSSDNNNRQDDHIE
eukprot:NODE_124_length_18806_cov_0.323996.p5 type:complete len:385 gc:universal NODE_124_length_18806_cov_0.323996:1169-2323(+)